MLITFALLLAHLSHVIGTNQQKKSQDRKGYVKLLYGKRWDQAWEINRKIQYPLRKKECKELNLFDPQTNIYINVTGERLSEFFYSLSLSSPSAVLLKSIEGMSIAIMNLSLINIANEVVVNHKNSSSDKKIKLLLRKLCFTEKEIQNIGKSTWGQSDSNAWKEHRKGWLTASKHHELYTNWSSI